MHDLKLLKDQVQIVRGQRALLVDIVARVERSREGMEVVERFAQPVSRVVFGHLRMVSTVAPAGKAGPLHGSAK